MGLYLQSARRLNIQTFIVSFNYDVSRILARQEFRTGVDNNICSSLVHKPSERAVFEQSQHLRSINS